MVAEDYEDNAFLNRIDNGEIGITRPQVTHTIDRGKVLWIVEDSVMVQRYVPEEELNKYQEAQQDNWAGSPSEQEME